MEIRLKRRHKGILEHTRALVAIKIHWLGMRDISALHHYRKLHMKRGSGITKKVYLYGRLSITLGCHEERRYIKRTWALKSWNRRRIKGRSHWEALLEEVSVDERMKKA